MFTVTGELGLRDAPREDPVLAVLQMAHDPASFRRRRVIVVRNLELTKAFTKGDTGKTHVSIDDIEHNPQWLELRGKLDWSKEKGFTAVETAARELLGRVHAFRQTGELLRVLPVSDDPEVAWVPIERAHDAFPDQRFGPLVAEQRALVDAFSRRDAAAFQAAQGALTARLHGYEFRVHPPDVYLDVERVYNRIRPFRSAALLCFLAASLFLIHRSAAPKPGVWWGAMGVLTLGVALHVAGCIIRTVVTGYAPVGSLYETIIWIGGVAALFALVFEATSRASAFGLAGALLGGVVLILADRLPLMTDATSRYVDPAMNPLVPVLRSYWLNIHVTCMLTSYAALGLACVLGLDHFVTWLRAGDDPAAKERLERLAGYNDRAIQVGFSLLTIGVLLGAVWANQSWGRYWGWDPKETWAFITWCVYAAYLHVRFMGWVKGPWIGVWNVAGFAAVIFTYIGVSFLLPGLHSYLEPS